MASPAILKLEVIADATKAVAALGKVGDSGKTTGSKLSGLKSTMVGVFGTAAVAAFGKASVGAALESQKAVANLEAGFKSMGDTTGDAAKAAEGYAASLSKKIGVDDDAIMAAQAQLVTFGAVSDETARAAGIFDRATLAAADLAAKGFGTLDSNSVQLGKALQDPTKGLGALGKAGVTFSDSQKETIKSMQESGDLLGAQKIVLKAIEDQVGGTAEATVTSQDKMSVAFGETEEAVGNALLPALEALAPILQTVAGFVEDNVGWLLPLAGGIAAVVVAVKAWSLATEVWTGIQKIATGVQAAFNAVMAANPVMLAVLAIAALIAIIVLAYQKVDWFRAMVDAAWQFIQKAWDGVLAAFQKVWDWIKKNWPLLLAILTGPIGAAVLIIVRNWETIRNAVVGVFDKIKQLATDVWSWVTDKFQAIADKVTGVMNTVKGALNSFIRGWNRLRVPKIELDIPGAKWIPGVPDSVSVGGWDLPNIPLLAAGGSVMRTGLAIVHAGETFSGVGKPLGGGGSVINVHVTSAGLGADAPEIQRAVVNALRGYVNRNGPLPIPVRSVA